MTPTSASDAVRPRDRDNDDEPSRTDRERGDAIMGTARNQRTWATRYGAVALTVGALTLAGCARTATVGPDTTISPADSPASASTASSSVIATGLSTPASPTVLTTSATPSSAGAAMSSDKAIE